MCLQHYYDIITTSNFMRLSYVWIKQPYFQSKSLIDNMIVQLERSLLISKLGLATLHKCCVKLLDTVESGGAYASSCHTPKYWSIYKTMRMFLTWTPHMLHPKTAFAISTHLKWFLSLQLCRRKLPTRACEVTTISFGHKISRRLSIVWIKH